MSTATNQAPPPPPGATPPVSEEVRDRTVLLIFLGLLAFSSGTFLLLALSGTTADPLGGPVEDGIYNWDRHAQALPTIQPRAIPHILRPPRGDDPLEWDTRPEGPPENLDLLPPETPPAAPDAIPVVDVAAQEEARQKALAQQAARKKALARVAEGDKLLRRNRYPQAKEAYTQAAKLEPSLKPKIAGRFFKKAKEQERKRSWSRAKLLYRMALHFDYENSKLHRALSSTSKALGDNRKAREHQRLAEKFEAQGK